MWRSSHNNQPYESENSHQLSGRKRKFSQDVNLEEVNPAKRRRVSNPSRFASLLSWLTKPWDYVTSLMANNKSNANEQYNQGVQYHNIPQMPVNKWPFERPKFKLSATNNWTKPALMSSSRGRLTVKESVRLEEKKRYAELLAKFKPERSSDRVQHISVTPFRISEAIKHHHERRNQSVIEHNVTTDKNHDPDEPEVIKVELPKRVLSPSQVRLQSILSSPVTTDSWLQSIKERYSKDARERDRRVREHEAELKYFEERRMVIEENLTKRVQERLRICERIPPVVEELFVSEEESEEEEEVVSGLETLTDEQDQEVNNKMRGSTAEVLVEAFKLSITRRDLLTLTGFNWLNDEVINFYMSLIMQRSESTPHLPNVHAFNTFFYPKVISNGHQGVKRWTKQMDVLGKDLILVPVHLGVHWCLAVIRVKEETIWYLDSMGGENNRCLQALSAYVSAESLDKRQKTLDTSHWTLVNIKDIPQQMNGSDCGVFTCKFADFIARNHRITFTQDNMPFFRRRMIYEILNKQLLW